MTLSSSAKESPHLDDALCRTCRKCVARSVCRTKAIRSIDPGEAPFIDGHLCMACYECVAACPHGAILRPAAAVHKV
jgi:MinD superfamily P-loop ATPase